MRREKKKKKPPHTPTTQSTKKKKKKKTNSKIQPKAESTNLKARPAEWKLEHTGLEAENVIESNLALESDVTGSNKVTKRGYISSFLW